LVLSHERLSGYPSSGGHDRRMIADRLRETFPQARILIVIREQRALFRSMYSQHITAGGTERLERFLHRPEPGLGRKPWFDPAFYAFDRLIAYYRGLFGADRILALPFELLVRDPQRFVDRLAAFCGHASLPLGPVSRENDRRPLLMQAIQRRLNALFYDNELSPGALLHIPRFAKRFGRLRGLFDACSPRFIERRLDARLVREIAAYAGDRFRESNGRTSRLIGIELGDYGYAMPLKG
ncbi:MAG TPA: sulfotransferase, partial [Allosphingosinicella sp.]